MTTTTQTYSIPNASEIYLEGWGDITLQQGEEDVMTIETDDSLLSKLKTEVNGKRLELGFKSKLDYIFGLRHQKINYTITLRNVDKISISGAGNLRASDLRAGEFEVKVSGAGKVELGSLQADQADVKISGSGDVDLGNVQCGRIKASVPGSGKVVVAGKAPEEEVSISGSGLFDGDDLSAEKASVSISGSGKASVNASKMLDVRISGLGEVVYKGQPSMQTHISGLGRINRA